MKRSHNRVNLLIFGIVLCFVAADLSSESPPSNGQDDPLILDRETSVARALRQNRDFKINAIALETTRREADNSWSVLIPDLSAGAALNHTEPFLSDPVVAQDGWTFSGSLNADLPIQAGLAYAVRQTRLDYQAQLITYDHARMQLVNRVEQEFYYLLAEETNIEILRMGLELARQRYEQTRINFNNGQASEVTMLQARVSAANKEPGYLSAQAAYRQRLQNFLIVLGMKPATDVVLQGSLETEERVFDADNLISTYLENRRDIQSQRATIESLRNNRAQLVAGGRTPVLSVSAGWSTNVTDPFDNESWRNGTWADSATLGLNLTVPLDGFIPYSKTDTSIRAIDDQITQAEIGLEELVATAEAEIVNLVAQLETSRANMNLSRLNVEYARAAYEMSEEAYSRGTMERLDVEDSQQSYLTATQSLLQSQFEYLSGLIDLRGALGLESL